ncbi:TonB-dependent receptor [Shewanella sp. D64]|uniref:TonB-dependent receptor n=1 Tax=unclassified Shewanella TaxID=196818 RepID=UPI0022BA5ACE|nr:MULTISPECIES: TonB-dependent receptor [unclassified Shewanella]MEC4725168.1 TonB-dependent receptor [Shewanella sp. D64]MEC4737069.1 TonB-dependent receptor [Shewanella sp. E94]WBJ96654.1 TonB-dependent receptor [Shewanella sp. MTB7]
MSKQRISAFALITGLIASFTVLGSEDYREETPTLNALTNTNNNLERITVTATRQQSLDTDLAMSLQGVSTEELAIDSGQHIAESLNSISGVLIDQLSGGQGHKAAIRMPMNTSGYYLYLQDNIPLQSPAFFNHNALWWSSFNSNIARMEVLKGAGTALYGSGAVAATINILSKEVAKSPQTDVGLTLGQDDYAKAQFSHSNILSDTQGIRVSASYLTNEGWRDHTGSERAELTFRHEFELADNERLVTSLVVSDLEQEMAGNLTQALYDNDKTNSGLSADVLANDPLRKTRYLRLSSQWDKTTDNNYFSLIPYYRYRTNDYTATWNKNMPKVESEVHTLGLLALANFEHESDSDTTVGLDIELTEGDQLSYQPLDYTSTGFRADTFTKGEVFYDDTTQYLSLSPYIQHKRELTDNLDLTLGARYDYGQYDFNNHLGVFGDIGHGKRSIKDRKDNFSHISPKASLNYHLTQDTSLYLRYANSFRLPTASSLYHLTIKDDGNAEAVDPEISDTYELGFKANWQSISLDTAVYYMDVDDGIVRAYNDAGQRYLTNAARVIHQGVEVSVAWKINEQLNLSTAYSRSHHEFDQHEAYSGNEMAAAPDYIANVRLRYMPTFAQGLTSMLEIQSIGEYWLDDANSQDDNEMDRIENGYTIANIKALYQFSKQLSFNARVLNVTNEEYAQEASYRYGKTFYSPGAPRTAYVGVNYQW